MAEPILSLVKPCKKCGSLDRSPSDGRCKPCKAANFQAYYAKNADRIKAYQAALYAKNPEIKKAKAKKYYEDNRAEVKVKKAVYQAENVHIFAARSREWAAKNPERMRARLVKWRKNNPDAAKVIYHNRREKEKTGKLSRDIAEKLLALQKGKCACCQLPLGDDYHLDHVMPLALGGTNTDDNVQLLRAKCNLQKNKKHPIDFMQERGFLL